MGVNLKMFLCVYNSSRYGMMKVGSFCINYVIFVFIVKLYFCVEFDEKYFLYLVLRKIRLIVIIIFVIIIIFERMKMNWSFFSFFVKLKKEVIFLCNLENVFIMMIWE